MAAMIKLTDKQTASLASKIAKAVKRNSWLRHPWTLQGLSK